jgi:hypothetical protein
MGDEDSLEMTKHSHDGADHEIQVVTDISVQVEGGSGRLSGWRTPTVKHEWENKEVAVTRHSSTNTLFKEAGQVV